jgi:hypothetical protein
MKTFIAASSCLAILFCPAAYAHAALRDHASIPQQKTVLAKTDKNKNSPVQNAKAAKAACLKNASQARQSSLRAAQKTKASALDSALSARKQSLANAKKLATNSARKTGLKIAWDIYGSSRQQALDAFKKSEKTINDTYRAASLECAK